MKKLTVASKKVFLTTLSEVYDALQGTTCLFTNETSLYLIDLNELKDYTEPDTVGVVRKALVKSNITWESLVGFDYLEIWH